MARLSVAILVAAVSARLALPPDCHAEDRAPMAQVPADVVKMKNGDLYRGTIIELVRNDHVVVLLPSGESRQFPMSEVSYAGAAAGAPSDLPVAAPQKVVSSPSEVEIKFQANQPDVRLMLRAGSATGVGYSGRGAVSIVANDYRDVCAAPCVATLPAGSQRLALSLAGGPPVEVEDAVSLTDAAVLKGTYESNSSTRVTGAALGIAATVVGVGIMILGIAHTQNVCDQFTGMCQDQMSINTGEVIAGTVVWLVGGIAGLAIGMSSPDKATLELNPTENGKIPPPLSYPAPGLKTDSDQ